MATNAADRKKTEPLPPAEPPHSETLKATDPPNPQPDDPENPKPLDQSGTDTMPQSSADQATLAGDASPPPPPIASPVNLQRRPPKRKKGVYYKRKMSLKKVKTLSDVLNPIPFKPAKILDIDKHEVVLRRLGLWDFSKIEFDRNIRTDLVSQLILYYDSKKRCSYVNEFRINVTRACLTRALKLPQSKQEKGGNSSIDEVDLDSDVFSDGSIEFIQDFVSNWVLLHDDDWTMPTEISNMTRFIKDGHPEKTDWASLIWYMVEKELSKGNKLVDCHYASHLQRLIKSQREEVFMDDAEEVRDEDDCVVGENNRDLKVQEEEEKSNIELNLGPSAREEEIHEDVKKDDEMKDKEVKDGETKVDEVKGEEVKGDEVRDEEVKGDEVRDEEVKGDEVRDEEVTGDEGKDQEVTGDEVRDEEVTGDEVKYAETKDDEVKDDETKDDEMIVEAEVTKAEQVKGEDGNWILEGKNDLGDHFMQRCQGSDLNTDQKHEEVEGEQVERMEDEQVERMEDEQVQRMEDDEQVQRMEDEQVERMEDEQLERMEDEQVEHMEDEQVEQVEDEDEDEEEEEEEDSERAREGFDLEANNDSLDGDGLTGNFLQGMETSHIPFGSQSELRGMSSVDLFGSRDGPSFVSAGGPSFFGNGGKRVMEHDEDEHHNSPEINNKRSKTEPMFAERQMDFSYCMEQIQSWMEKGKMMYEAKEQSYANSQFDQQMALNQLQERQNMLELIIKSKDEELQRKHTDALRLERELYLMGDLLAGYRKALNDTRAKFSEYRKLHAVHEEPLYKDAGPGGLVLSTRELERQRIKQEEDRMTFMMWTKDLEEHWKCEFEMHQKKVLMMVDKLDAVENEVKMVRELYAQREEMKTAQGEAEVSAQPKENQKVEGEVAENNASMEPEVVLPDVVASEMQEVVGGDDESREAS